jgi:phosphatidate cytidylyltransferase
MSKIAQRLLIFIIGVPVVAALVLFLPERHHLAMNIVVLVLAGFGGFELNDILARKAREVSRRALPTVEAIILSLICPLTNLFILCFAAPANLFRALVVAALFWALASRVFTRKQEVIEASLGRFAASACILVYPGIFLIFLQRMALFPHAGIVITIFLLMVFGNDSLAWFFGMLLGKGNQGIVPVSPKKSIAGFIGGILTSVVVGICAALFLKSAFGGDFGLVKAAVLGCVTAIAGNLGDLAESALKRSVGVKDSGTIMPGRGGILDSLDSICLAAPVFYGLYLAMF